ncbi:hypothetical protein Ancab_021031 [Ancistrocladus abbreviatus]
MFLFPNHLLFFPISLRFLEKLTAKLNNFYCQCCGLNSTDDAPFSLFLQSTIKATNSSSTETATRNAKHEITSLSHSTALSSSFSPNSQILKPQRLQITDSLRTQARLSQTQIAPDSSGSGRQWNQEIISPTVECQLRSRGSKVKEVVSTSQESE